MPFQWTYLKTSQGKPTRFKKFIRNTIGKEPLFLDTNLMKESANQISEFLKNKGYFYNSVTYSIQTKNKKAHVYFNLSPGKEFYIDSIEYLIYDRKIEEIFKKDNQSLLYPGMPYDADILKEERNRMTGILKNKGFYGFGQDYISYLVDTSRSSERKLGLEIVISNPSDTMPHKVYSYRHITINPDYSILDTMALPDTFMFGYFIKTHSRRLHPSAYLKYITIKSGENYNETEIRDMINRLSQIPVVKFVDANFTEIQTTRKDSGLLDVEIRITLAPSNTYNIELEANTTEENKQLSTAISTRYYGMAGNIKYTNRNLFHRGLQLNLNTGGAFDIPIKSAGEQNLFTNYQIEGNASLLFPRAFLPGFLSLWDRAYLSKTAISLTQFFEKNFDFTQQTTNLGVTYQFNYRLTRHFFTPIELSRIRNQLTPDFQEKLSQYNNPLLNSIFETHLLPVFRYAFSYNNKSINPSSYWRIYAIMPELAGNIPWLYNYFQGNTKNKPDTVQLELFNTPFFQFARFDVDLTYNRIFNVWSSLAWHLNMGFGLPYGNSSYLPFEKRFYAGGVNSMRAWPLRGLGPGAYHSDETARFIQTGEMKWETNLEYRFEIVSVFEGALFTDIGNIWTVKKDASLPEGNFEWKDFYKELASDIGFGLRLNFVYFIVRLDFAVPVTDPAMPAGERWVLDDVQWKDVGTRIGIGYPF